MTNKDKKNKRVQRSAMQWNGIGINEDDDEIAYLNGFIENVSYDDVFGKRENFGPQNHNLSSVYSNNDRYSGSEDDDVWAILVTPKPLTVKDSNSVIKNKQVKKKIKKVETIHDYDKKVRQTKRKISDLAIKASTTTKSKKQPINPIVVSQTEFGEKRF